jgi:predicted AAA+ superfamily ATPase
VLKNLNSWKYNSNYLQKSLICYNGFGGDKGMLINRPDYLRFLHDWKNKQIIKVISGIRRSGKSTLFEMFVSDLKAQGINDEQIIQINFEDVEYEELQDYKSLYNYVKSRLVPGQMTYIFLDEIQHVEKFEKLLASLKAKFNCSIFVTGSDSTMLSGELATLLTGRTVEFEIFPFSFKESIDFLSLNNIECVPDDFIKDYIKWGGFPLRFSFREETSIKRFLDNLYSNIINRDIIKKSSKMDKKTFKDNQCKYR